MGIRLRGRAALWAPGGMKAHTGVDAASGRVYPVVPAPAKLAEVIQARALRHGEGTEVFGAVFDQGASQGPRQDDR